MLQGIPPTNLTGSSSFPSPQPPEGKKEEPEDLDFAFDPNDTFISEKVLLQKAEEERQEAERAKIQRNQNGMGK